MSRIAQTPEEITVWHAAYGAAYAVHVLMNHYDDAKADHYARNVGDRAVMAMREGAKPRKPRERRKR